MNKEIHDGLFALINQARQLANSAIALNSLDKDNTIVLSISSEQAHIDSTIFGAIVVLRNERHKVKLSFLDNAIHAQLDLDDYSLSAIYK